MSEFESAFLCGLLDKFRPSKILEVGVAAGVTTAIILQCLEDNAQKYSMYSIDASVQFYREPQHQSGFWSAPLRESLQHGTHELYIGTTLPHLIDNIGNGVDFVILDTVHMLPGEVLDFLTVLPYLSEDAVVCMHDVSFNQRSPQHLNNHATGALFASVTANKFLNFIIDDTLSVRYPNIAAFQITPDTMRHIENVFLALILRWMYLPSGNDLKGYTESFLRHYPHEFFAIFQEALRLNYKNMVASAQR